VNEENAKCQEADENEVDSRDKGAAYRKERFDLNAHLQQTGKP